MAARSFREAAGGWANLGNSTVIILEFHRLFIGLLAVSRLIIGIGFVGVCLELLIIVRALKDVLLFSRTVRMFALAIGVCGVARLVDGYLLLGIGEQPLVWREVTVWVFDTLSAVTSQAAVIVILPLMWNALGGHIWLKKL